jgi:hypothetical protein
VLTGHIDDYPLAELLFFLSSKQRTGILVLERPGVVITFTLRSGRLIAAQMHPPDHRLGDRLLAEGTVSADSLRDVLEYQRRYAPDLPLGALLVDQRCVEREVVLGALRRQISDCLVAFLIAPGGTFAFTQAEIDTSGLDVDVVVEREVLEAIRRADEHIARQIDTGPLRLSPHVDASMLQPFILDNWELIDAMIGGAQTVDEIVAETKWDRARVVTSLSHLQAHGAIDLSLQHQELLSVSTVASACPTPRKISALESTHRWLAVLALRNA